VASGGNRKPKDKLGTGTGQIDQEIAALTGSIGEQLTWRIPETFKMETFIFFIYMGWRALAFMLMGMGLFRLGFFSNGFHKKTYWLMVF
jgi:hypothetical protein